MAYKTEIQNLKVSLPSKKHEMTHTANAGAIKLQVHSSGATQILFSYFQPPWVASFFTTSLERERKAEEKAEFLIAGYYCLYFTRCYLMLLMQFIQHRTDLICN